MKKYTFKNYLNYCTTNNLKPNNYKNLKRFKKYLQTQDIQKVIEKELN